MKDKYFQALCVLSEILLEKGNELEWKDTQIEMRDKQIDNLKAQLEQVEKHTHDVSQRNQKQK